MRNTEAGMPAKRAIVIAVALLVASVAAPSRAPAKGAAFGDYVKAARALSEWRYDDARKLIGDLRRESPDEPETKYLTAELAFLDGDYERAKNILAKLKDPRVRDLVEQLQPLVLSTLEATKGFASRETPSGRFVIYYPPGKDELLVDLAAETLDAAWAAIGEDLGWKPTEKIRVEILPRTRDLAKVSTLTEKEIEASGTIALCKYNKLMLVSPRATLFGYPWLDTITHEYVHYVVTRATNDKVPVWLHEGLAKFEETRWREAGGAQELGRLYEHLLATAMKRGRLVTFEEMHPSMAKLPTQEAASTAFAEVYTMVDWLHEKVGYAGLREVLAKIKDGKSERRAIVEVMGPVTGAKSWEALERQWKRHLKDLGLSTDPSKPSARKLKFQKSDGSDENVGVEEIGEKEARKLARLGGLLRTRGRLAAAAVEYEKARTHAPNDLFIAHKLARTYLELGEARKAVDLAEPLVAHDEDDAVPRATLGAAYLLLGEMPKAREHLLAALRVSPFDPAVRCGLAEVYEKEGDTVRGARERAACTTLGDVPR